MKNKNLLEIKEFLSENLIDCNSNIDEISYFFEEIQEVGIDYRRIQQIDGLGMYIFNERIEVFKRQILEGVFKGEEYEDIPFDINEEYYLFDQIKLKDFSKNIVIGNYSPVGYKKDMGINWGKMIPYFYNVEEVKGAIVRYKFK